ncbi:hypothetical protein ACWF50_00920 [Brucella pseudogrignonensis]|jgi:hypothetical protein|uniref:Putative membrane protein n=1 Tax=Brucella pseudogrignonensis TaxID=419475 RepID=A0A256GJK6_9HYPH|nr:hypothetical protein [Brucella pseudogrignonensis]EMG54918.1 hypothetical protein WYI_04569 [Ochrobactrum sp. CDB2]MCM0751860.1 hypothetical protein [Brucella pseudogrignonensis]NNV20791.1 hypothetical protein [Brucella pseudogrignonensis]OYR27345.1 putative membrane protein [Brucella pseudogrignonensis]
MIEDKPWYLSRTVWAGLVALFLSLAGAFGLVSETVDQGPLTDILLQLATAIAGLIAVFGRIGATSRIS